MIRTLQVRCPGKGLHRVTREIEAVVREAGVAEGLCTVHVRHTSASIVVQENADSRVLDDLETWMEQHIPEGHGLYTHDDEGPDDMPSHIRSAITASSVSIPILGGRLALGTWQGIYLWEHRRHARTRSLVVHVGE